MVAATVSGLQAGKLTGRTDTDLPPGAEPLVAFAGPWSAARWRCDRRPTLSDPLDADPDGDAAVLTAAGGSRAGAPVGTVAGRIAAKGVARHADVCEALGIPAKDNGHELSLIRSGAAPGSFRVTKPVAV